MLVKGAKKSRGVGQGQGRCWSSDSHKVFTKYVGRVMDKRNCDQHVSNNLGAVSCLRPHALDRKLLSIIDTTADASSQQAPKSTSTRQGQSSESDQVQRGGLLILQTFPTVLNRCLASSFSNSEGAKLGGSTRSGHDTKMQTQSSDSIETCLMAK